jgi:hypothetical protein
LVQEILTLSQKGCSGAGGSDWVGGSEALGEAFAGNRYFLKANEIAEVKLGRILFECYKNFQDDPGRYQG